MAIETLSGSFGMKGVSPTNYPTGMSPEAGASTPSVGGTLTPNNGLTPMPNGGGSGSFEDDMAQTDSGPASDGGSPSYAYKKGGRVVTTRMKPSMKRNDKCSNW